jgi:hypothetical protein
MAVVTLQRTSTVSLAATTADQLIANTAGECYFNILNHGPGNLFVRFDQAPTGATDPLAFEIPANAPLISFHLFRGLDGLFVLADQAGSISVLNTSR